MYIYICIIICIYIYYVQTKHGLPTPRLSPYSLPRTTASRACATKQRKNKQAGQNREEQGKLDTQIQGSRKHMMSEIHVFH